MYARRNPCVRQEILCHNSTIVLQIQDNGAVDTANSREFSFMKREILLHMEKKSLWIEKNSSILREKSFLIKRKSKNSSLQRKRNPLFKKKRNPFSWIQNYGCSSTRSSRESFPEVKASESSLMLKKYFTRAPNHEERELFFFEEKKLKEKLNLKRF